MTRLPYSSATSGDKAMAEHAHNFIEMAGLKFGKWLIKRHIGDRKWLCICECGTECEIDGAALRNGRSTQCKRCASIGKVCKHGKASLVNGKFSRKYRAWLSMINRTSDKKSPPAKWYQDVTVHQEWANDFTVFDHDVSDPPSENHTLDRTDNTKGYEPGNVRWATKQEQARNRRSNKLVTINGMTQCLAAWAEELGIKSGTLALRLKNGQDPLFKGDLRKQRGLRLIEHARANKLLQNKEQS